MNVMLVGASGFIGSHLVGALRLRGHHVICAGRTPPQDGCADFVAIDFSSELDPSMWISRLNGVGAVINTVGIFNEKGGQTFEALHVQGPRALFQACAAKGIRQVIQVSALGANEGAGTNYHLSKKRSDDELLRLIPDAIVVQPSLVFGADGMSARWFAMLASLPLIPVPTGNQWIQPVHVEDVVEALMRLLEHPGAYTGKKVPLVGPAPLALRHYLAVLRTGLGLPPARFLAMPFFVVRLSARIGSVIGIGLVNEQSLQMLVQGNIGDSAALTALLAREPRAADSFVSRHERPALAIQADLAWLRPILMLSLALVWIVTGVVSIWVYPMADSLALLHRSGVPEALSPLMLYGAGGLDLALGLATLAWPTRRLWAVQAALILFYTLVITLRLTEFWAHPYGPILKNIPMLAMLLLLYVTKASK